MAGIDARPRSYWVYQDGTITTLSYDRIFEGPAWNYVCLESDIEHPGEFRTTFVGEMPVIVVRGDQGEIHAFENRCAHRGALIALEDAGTVKRFQCIYHAWSYNLRGDLVGIAFEKGSYGRGGMPPGFCKEEHAPRKLDHDTERLVFATLSGTHRRSSVPREQAGPVRRVLRQTDVCARPLRAVLPKNWSSIARTSRTRYHASLLHAFFGTFRITRLTQGGGVAREPRRRASHEHHDGPRR